MSTLIDILSKTDGRTRQTAVNTLVEVASAASGQTGCARATDREVSILLGALQNDSEIVRDAALRALIAMKNALEVDNQNLVNILLVNLEKVKTSTLRSNLNSLLVPSIPNIPLLTI